MALIILIKLEIVFTTAATAFDIEYKDCVYNC